MLFRSGVEFLAPDMGVQFLHGGDRRDLDGAVVKVRDVTGAAIRKDVDGAEGQPLIFGIHFIEDDRWFSLRCALPKELDVLGLAKISPHRFFISTGRPDHFGQHHQIVDVLGIDAEHILVGVEVKQIHAAVIFLKLPDHAPALTRPGRFDRRVPVELPDLKGREAILKVHAKKIKPADDVDFHTIARMASGASGAELANIVNEAALRAVRQGRTIVHEADLEESVEVVIAGYQKKNAVLSDQEKKVVAYHEIGHALVAALQSHSAPVQKITIIPRTSGALGYTMQVEQGDKYLMTKEEIENKIATFTGGRAAEEVVFNQITTGASNDIEQATKLARAMITRYGMSDEFDMVALETVTNQYLGGDASLACSADTQKEIDRQVTELVKKQHQKAKKLLLDNRDKLDELSNYLYEKETITGEEFMEILNRDSNTASGGELK